MFYKSSASTLPLVPQQADGANAPTACCGVVYLHRPLVELITKNPPNNPMTEIKDLQCNLTIYDSDA